MWRLIGLAVLGLVVVGVGLWLVLLVAMRTKYQPVLTFIRRMNRKVTNPRVLKTAGQAGSSTAVIHHVGRSTGAPYRTPIGVVDTADGFVVVLPYGTSPDWLKNVVAAGSAVVEFDGRTHTVNDPEVVGAAEVSAHFSRKDELVRRLYGVDQVLVLKRVDANVAGGVD
ncbi:MAG TPA: nitroreductase family deazaflavin-dependent oxidoreductase [Jiangellaceae bacterium]